MQIGIQCGTILSIDPRYRVAIEKLCPRCSGPGGTCLLQALEARADDENIDDETGDEDPAKHLI